MNRVICSWLGAALLTGIAGAQTIGPGLNATIPFEFKAGNKVMQAGAYTVRTPDARILHISNLTSGDSAIVIVGATRSRAHHDTGTLVFNRYGDQYFLSRVIAATGEGILLAPSKLEREHLAKGKPQSATVVASRTR
jgi:hypothetical protein